MKNRSIFFIIFLIYFLGNNFLYAQQKIIFHTDRDYYFPGDTVWYKSYIHLNGNLDTSIHNLAVVFGTETGEILQQQLSPASLGLSFGQYVLPEGFEALEMFVNIYTKRNIIGEEVVDPAVFKLAVIQKKMVPEPNEANLAIQVEGNGWIPNAVNKILFQWNNKQVNQAILVDEEGKELQNLQIDSNAKAITEIQSDSKKLFVHWKHKNKSYIDTVPVLLSNIRMRVAEANDSTYLWIDNQSELSSVHFQYRQGEFILLDSLIHVEKGTSVKIPIENWMNGRFYGQFLLKDKEQILSTINFKSKLNPTLTIEPEYMIYRPYAPQRIKLDISGLEEWNLSVSIVDGLIPNSALKSELEDYQFESSKFSFTYMDIAKFNENEQQIYDPIANLSGKIIMEDDKWQKFMELKNDRQNSMEKKRQKFRTVSFGIKKLAHLNYLYREVDFDSLGNLLLPHITFEDTAQIRIVQIDKRLKTVDYKLELQFSPLATLKKLAIPDYIKNLDLSIQYQGKFDPTMYSDEFGKTIIKPVGIERRRKDAFNRNLNVENSRDWFILNEADLNIDMETEDLPAYVFEFKDLMRHLRRKYPVLGPDGFSQLQPLMLINNNTMVGPQNQFPEDITEVKYIRYYKNYPFDKNGNGLVMVYTTGINARNKDIGLAKIKKSLISGYSVIKDFHHAKYDGEVLVDYDDRQTLYWNPGLAMKGGEPMTISFYNSGRNSSFNIRIRGVSKSGKILDVVKHLQEDVED